MSTTLTLELLDYFIPRSHHSHLKPSLLYHLGCASLLEITTLGSLEQSELERTAKALNVLATLCHVVLGQDRSLQSKKYEGLTARMMMRYSGQF